jgi:hypothetical protein
MLFHGNHIAARSSRTIAVIFLLASPVVRGASSDDESRKVAVSPSAPAEPVSAGRWAWYLPNRLLDLTDIVRLRVKAGPGLSAGLRATDYLSFYGGRHHVAYVGLPGPRYPERWSAPYGWEQDRGLIFFGVDATDSFDRGPRYAHSEIDAGIHLLFLGAEMGIDPIEIGDFFAGLFMVDVRGDDLETIRPDGSGRDDRRGSPLFRDGKPGVFRDLGHRLDYVQTNFTWGLAQGAGWLDARFAEDDVDVIEFAPQSRLRLGVYGEVEEDDGFQFAIDPDFSWEIALPNLERRWSLFINAEDSDELPGIDPEDREGSLFVGVSRAAKEFHLRSSAGVKTKWVPEAFGRLEWRRAMDTKDGSVMPKIRGFWESDDGFGLLSVVMGRKWIGASDGVLLYSTTAGTWTEDKEGVTVEQTIGLAWLLRMIEDPNTIRDVSREDVGKGWGIRASTFAFADGDGTHVSRHRITLGHRRPLYRDWIHLDVGPELEWSNDNDWDTVPRLRVGIETLFWGIGQG